MQRKGKSVTVHGTLVAVSADNLAAHLLGGYRALHSSIRRCRFCMATADESQTKVRY